MSEATLTIPGLIFVGAEGAGKDAAVVHLGAAVGWTIPRGVHTWSRELSVVLKEALTPELRRELGVALPEEQGDPELVPRARRAAQACKVVAVERPLSDQLPAKGVRVHTVGFDRVSNGFFYFATGGGEPKRVQGELIEIIAPSLGAGSREDLEAGLDGLIDRLLAQLSDGTLSEAQLELAEALPPLGPKSAQAGDKLQTLEGWLILSSTRSAKFEADAKRLAETLRSAARRETDVVEVPLFGQARRVMQPDLEVEVIEGEAGKRSRLTLPARTRWFVSGGPSASMQPAAQKVAAAAVASRPEPSPRQPAVRADGPPPSSQARANEAAARAAADRAAAEKAAAERAAEAQRAAERAAAEKAAAERAAAERAAAERAAADRAAAEKAAAERAAAERVAAEKAAAERAAHERVEAQRVAAEKAAAERAAAERAAAESAAAQRVAAQSVATERIAAKRRQAKKEPTLTVGFVLLMLAVGATIGAVFGVARRFVGF
jgi:hypothetical protein